MCNYRISAGLKSVPNTRFINKVIDNIYKVEVIGEALVDV